MILIIDKSTKKAQTYAEIFHFMGVLAYPASPYRATLEVTNRYRAILIADIENAMLDEEFFELIKRQSLGAPVFALVDNRKKYLKENGHSSHIDEYFESRVFSSTLYDEIEKYQTKNGMPVLGQYRLAGIDASIRLPEILYHGDKTSFSKTETMIIRYLIRHYPLNATAADILKHAFKQGKTPGPSSVRTHICIINRKFKQLTSRPLISYTQGRGYSILTPERIEAMAKA